DRNGNETQYTYTDGRLTAIVDPVGLQTTFAYTGDKVTAITDPAQRVTRLEYDAAGNLTRITDPDGTSRRWEYNGDHLMTAEVDKRGFREKDVYDFAGRAMQAVRKDGSMVQVAPVQVQGLRPAAATIDPLTAPIAAPLGPPVASYADGNGNVT